MVGPRRGKVIEFPQGVAEARPEVAGSTALDPAETIPLRRPEQRVERRAMPVPRPTPGRSGRGGAEGSGSVWAQVNWLRFGMIALVGVSCLVLVRWFVHANSQATFHPAGMREPVPTLNGPPVPAGRDAPAEGPRIGVTGAELPVLERPDADPYADVEDALRDALRDGMLDVERPGDLGDALLIELRQVRLDIIKVDAEVTTWAGRKKDVPQSAMVRIRLRASPDELERVIAGTALVVGKYLQHYSMEAETFEVIFEGIDDGAVKVSIDDDLARRFYLQRVDMQGLLDELRGG